jgi:hypothetical protein
VYSESEEEPDRPLPLDVGSCNEPESDGFNELPEFEEDADESHGVSVVVGVCASTMIAEATRRTQMCATAIVIEARGYCGELLLETLKETT